ncbi:hypothetical protein [Rhodoblastus sp.]|uniref:hypothetical protein n=1 Tax=Rhodoblastus sp. TaxID=1962975 RepID=UPI003F980988
MSVVFLDWRAEDSAHFGRRPLAMRHRAHLSPLFSDAALIRLIDATPREKIHVNTMPRDIRDPRLWREGDLGGLPGEKVMEAVARGNLWLHLRRVQETDPAYGELLDALFGEIADHVPGFRSYRRSMSVLASSPNMSVAYHSDMPGQSLWQVRGRKRAYIYPAAAPFLPQRALENIALKRDRDTDLPYNGSFDAQALTLNLEGGDWATWPRACPHRVVNADCVNVSFTTEHWTDELRAGYAVDYANGLLRPWFGDRDFSRQTRGPAALVKFGVAGAHKALTAQLGRRRPARLGLKIDFRVDPAAPDGFVDIAPYRVAR